MAGVIDPPAPPAQEGKSQGTGKGRLMRVWGWAKEIAVFAYELLTNV